MVEPEERRAISFLLDFEYLLAELYTRANTGQGLSSSQRALNAGPVIGGRKVNFATPIVKAFVEEAAIGTAAHIPLIREFLAEVGERPYPASSIELERSFASMARGAAILQGDRSFDVFASESDLILGAFMLEDVGLTACVHALQSSRIKWARELLVGLHGSLASRTAIVRAFLYDAGLAHETNAIAVFRQKSCCLYGTVYQDCDHGVGDRHSSTMMPVDGRALAWGRTIEQCAAILGGVGQSTRHAFFPAGINALLTPDPQRRTLIPTYQNELSRGADSGVRLVASFDSERVELPAMVLETETFAMGENTPHQPWTESAYSSFAPSCIEISNALVQGAVGIVGCGQHAIAETLWHTEPRRHRYDIVAGTVHLDIGTVESLDGKTVSILVGAAESYWHTLIDVVARLALVPESIWPKIRRVLYPSTGVRIAELLRLFELPENVEQREVRPYETFEVEELLQPSSLHGLFDYHPSLLSAVFARLRMKIDLSAHSPKRIFIDRRASRLRKLTNEDELIAALPDFLPVRLEDLSIEEQIRLFSGAEIIVAPHGAGLTNIGFSRPGTYVVELMMDAYCNWCYRRLAALSNLHYRCVLGRHSPFSNLEAIHFATWTVDKDDLLREIESIRALASAIHLVEPND